MRKGRGEVKKLGDLFDVYRKRLRAPERSVIEAFCEVVDDVIGLKLSSKDVRYTPQSKTLALTVAGPRAQEVRLHKEEILAHLKGRLGVTNAPKEIL